MKTASERRPLTCTFCGKAQGTVKKLIAGPGVYICDECIDLCNDIIAEELAEAGDAPRPARRPLTADRLRDLDRRARAMKAALDELMSELRQAVEETEDGEPDPGGSG